MNNTKYFGSFGERGLTVEIRIEDETGNFIVRVNKNSVISDYEFENISEVFHTIYSLGAEKGKETQ